MKECKWCGERFSKLAKSHIIPKSFFNYDKDNEKVIVAVDIRQKRRPIGSYDSSILCQQCEANYSHIDTRAHDILIKDFSKNLILFGDKRDRSAYQIDGCFRTDIKHFLLYTLWRASVSRLDEFRGTDLGRRYEELIKEILISGEDISKHSFSFAAFKIANPVGTPYPLGVLKKDYSGRNYYTLCLANYMFDVKIDQRVTPEPYSTLVEYENVVFGKMETTPPKLKAGMAKITKEHYRNFLKY